MVTADGADGPGFEHRLSACFSAASLMMLVVPVGEVVAVLLMERWGRVRALQLALVPFCAGCVVIAVADSFDLILVGKVLTGVSLGRCSTPSY